MTKRWVNWATKFTLSWSTSWEDERRGNENSRRTGLNLLEQFRKSLNFEGDDGEDVEADIYRFESFYKILKMLRKKYRGSEVSRTYWLTPNLLRHVTHRVSHYAPDRPILLYPLVHAKGTRETFPNILANNLPTWNLNVPAKRFSCEDVQCNIPYRTINTSVVSDPSVKKLLLSLSLSLSLSHTHTHTHTE